MRPKHEIGNIAIMTAAVVGPFLGLLLAIYFAWNQYVFPSDLVLFGVLAVVLGMGATVGYHRMLTHQGFDAPAWLRGLFLILGSMAYAGSRPDEWAATHIRHHAHSDEEGDPHSPLEGFWHAHFGWLFSLRNFSDAKEYAPHLLQDPVVMFVSRYSTVWMLLSFAIPFAIGGWTGLLWGGVVRLFWSTHTTWSVNSICHTFGRRPFETTDESRNEWVIGLLAFGEGWHNNHHAFPRNAFHGMRWWQFDLSGLLIRALEKIGLVWNVQRVSFETELAHRGKAAAMWQALGELRQSALASIAAARRQWALSANEYMNSLSEAQLKQWETLQMDSVKRLDDMHEAVLRSAHLKRAKLLQYQREAERLAAECKQKLAAVTGSMANA